MSPHKRNTITRLAAGLGTAVLGWPGGSLAQAPEPLPVLASFSILGDWVRVVGGERVAVSTLIGIDADAHAFEPSPADARRVLRARLLVLNGLHFEPWAQKLALSAGYKGVTLTASDGIQPLASPKGRPAHDHDHDHDDDHDHGDVDPHAWHDPVRAMVYVKNIAKALSGLDAQGADSYQRNADLYLKELQALDDFAKTSFAPLPASARKVVTAHQAFNYLGARYQIEFMAAQGLSTQAEPSARAVAQLIQTIRKENIRAIFPEKNSNTRVLSQIAREAGIPLGQRLYTGALSGPGEPASTYLGMMRHNISQIAAALQAR